MRANGVPHFRERGSPTASAVGFRLCVGVVCAALLYPAIDASALISSASERTPRQCATTQLSVAIPNRVGTAATAMDGSIFSIWFRNTGSPCELHGFPVLSLRSRSGSIALRQVNSITSTLGDYGNAWVTLRTGSVATVLVYFGLGPGYPYLPCATSIDVKITRAAVPVTVNLDEFHICQGTHAQLIVSTYHPASVPIFGTWPSRSTSSQSSRSGVILALPGWLRCSLPRPRPLPAVDT
jgi:hypothetical protein